jgi:hypothetical protein
MDYAATFHKKFIKKLEFRSQRSQFRFIGSAEKSGTTTLFTYFEDYSFNGYPENSRNSELTAETLRAQRLTCFSLRSLRSPRLCGEKSVASIFMLHGCTTGTLEAAWEISRTGVDLPDFYCTDTPKMNYNRNYE